jgi:hypothetical protein
MGESYKLNITLTPEQLKSFGAEQSQIAIAKTGAGSNPQILWQSIRPIEELSVSWEENYGIYATESQMVAGATIVSAARTEGAAINGEEYALNKLGFFVPEGRKGNPASYYARNGYTEHGVLMGFGLTQTAALGNGTKLPPNPVSYAAVIPGSLATMTPATTLYVWTQSLVKGGSVVTEITGPQLEVPFGNGIYEQSLVYGETMFEFANPKVAKELGIETFVPDFY